MVSLPGQAPEKQKTCGECRQDDEARIRIGGVVVSMVRKNNLCVPAEFSAYIPRAQIRRRFEDGRLTEEEIILSSITLVHAPRHRPGGEEHPPDGPPSPAGRWDANGAWSEPKVAAARSVPRVLVNGREGS